MFLRDNYVHGDLHSGNLLYTEGDGHVTVLDAGLACSLSCEHVPVATLISTRRHKMTLI